MNQLELNAAPRKRVQLLADQPAAPDGGEAGGASLRVAMEGDVVGRRVRRVLVGAPDTEMAHAMKRALAATPQKTIQVDESHLVDLLPMTAWFEGPAPCTGWWDVKDAGAEFAPHEVHRLWFDAVGQQWRTAQGSWIHVGELTKTLKYRGLKQPYEKGYRYAVPGAKLLTRRVDLVD